MNDDNKDEFIKAYKITALWSSNDESTPSGGEPMDRNYDEDDFDPETESKMNADCEEFLGMAAHIIEAAEDVKCGPDFDRWGRAGHDFWLTRNGHGAGFWDGDWPAPQDDALTKLAQSFGEYNLLVGDDGKIHGM